MFTQRGMYKCLNGGGFYKAGKSYWLTLEYKGWFKWKRIEVTCRHGWNDDAYTDSLLVYKDRDAFNEDWEAV